MAKPDVIMPIEALGEMPVVRKISTADVGDALQRGVADFMAMPTHAVFLVALYPVIGLLLAALTFGYDLLPILYPLAAGFALVGPFAAIGLYELSRRREEGLDTSWRHVADIRHSPSFGAILWLGVVLVGIFAVWIFVAQALYAQIIGSPGPQTLDEFVRVLFRSREGTALFVIGNAVGFVFAAVAFALSVVSFPLLLDRHVGFGTAVGTSLKAITVNPWPMALWALTVAAAMFLGSMPFLIGLAVVMPVLGHASWHLYRRVVEADLGPRPPFEPSVKEGVRLGAAFSSSLFARTKLPPDSG